jgi:hypothetical protein
MSVEDSESLIYSEHTCGSLLRRLNALCVKALRAGDQEAATKAAEMSSSVEDAMRFVGLTTPE